MKISRRPLVFAVLTALSVTAVIVESCKSNDLNTAENSKKGYAFLENIYMYIPRLKAVKIVVPPTRAMTDSAGILAEDEIWIYFDRPEAASVPPPGGGPGGGDTGAGDPTMPLPQTTTDLLDMASGFGSDLSFVQDGTYTDSLKISETEARNALRPLIDQSRTYLVTKGLTQLEITQALQEENLEETLIIPVASALAAEDASAPTVPNPNPVTMTMFDPFSNQAFAESNYSRAIRCAMEALGVDLVYMFRGQSITRISKALFKRALKVVASKILGPASVLIVMVDFGLCMQ